MTDECIPFLNIGITLAIFRLSGYIPEEIERLKIFTSAGARMGSDSLMNLVEISSCPVELLFFRFLTVSIISVIFVLCRKIDWGQDLLSISYSQSCFGLRGC